MEYQKMVKFFSWAVIILTGIVIGFIIVRSGYSENLHSLNFDEAIGAEVPAGLQGARDLNQVFVSVSEAVLPGVVSIGTSQIVEQPAAGQMNPLFRDFFNDFFGDNFQFKRPENQRLEALGSGVLFNENGYILTNNHVIQNADDIQVELFDKRQFEAELIGADLLTELAVIKIDGDDLQFCRLGDSESVQVGEWVLAIGNPLRLYSTVTAGIISAKSRALGIIRDPNSPKGGSYAVENFLQTDAAINPGNSGGALVNLNGEVIGINTAIATKTGGYQGYGFAVPINLAKKVAWDLIEDGQITRAWLGISMRPVTVNIAKRYGMERPHGVLIEQVMEYSPAEKAGLKPLDILVELDGKTIDRSNQVQSAVLLKNPGDAITLTVLRNGDRKTIHAVLAKREAEVLTSVGGKSGELKDLGMEVHNLTPEISSKLQHHYYANEAGVIVTAVKRYSPAAEAGIRSGNLIQKIEDKIIKSVSDYQSAMKETEPGQVVIFTLLSGQTKRHAFIKIPEKE
ncbi:Do family serine endopeptidase [bacterium]|nr:Do family serine endopeptidase [bacterium]